jgi:hypothetical protein
MTKATFDDYLDDLAETLKTIRTAKEQGGALLARHIAQDMGSVTDFTGRRMTEAQYDAAITTLGNLDTFWSSGNGTNIEAVLTEKP